MSNILPKKSWHVYNDKNREKVRKDETGARIEKERTEERAKVAEREHRLSLLRSRANVQAVTENELEKNQNNSKRFELFSAEDGFKDEIKGDYKKDLELKKQSQNTKLSNSCSKKSTTSSSSNKNVDSDHWKNDPMHEKHSSLPKKKSNYGNNKDYSFV